MTSRCVAAIAIHRKTPARSPITARTIPAICAFAAATLGVSDQAWVHAAAATSPWPDQPTEIGGYKAPSWRAPEIGSTCVDRIFSDGNQSGMPVQVNGPGTPLDYRSFGGYTIKIDRHTLTVTDRYGRNTVQHWGDPHENLNGKHIKDWGGAPGWSENRRSLVLGDGSKLTLSSQGAHGVVTSTAIYDRGHNTQFDNTSNTVAHHSADPIDTAVRDAEQFDGETAAFSTDPDTVEASYDNRYNETFDDDGNPVVVPVNRPLGTTGGCANPNQVNDLFDDPRLGHT